MDKRTDLRERLIALAEGEPTVESLVAIDEDSFVLLFASGIEVEIEDLADSPLVALTSMIGTPGDSERLRVYEAALTTGCCGATMAGSIWRSPGSRARWSSSPRFRRST